MAWKRILKGQTVTSSNVTLNEMSKLGKYAFKKYEESLNMPLCFIANQNNSTIAMLVTGTPTLGQNFSYSTDGSNWNTFTPGTTTVTLANAGDKVYFKGNNPNGIVESASMYYRFSITGSIAASGNIMSLIDDGACTTLVIPNDYCFWGLFAGAPLTSTPALPATTLKNYCYEYMFASCKALTNVTELPATTLTIGCYQSMFANCTSLISVPALPATTLATDCYKAMFYYCTSLYVSNSLISGTAEQAWTIPSSGTFTNTFKQSSMFTNCLGTHSSDMAGIAGQSYTYYTQNAPVV